MDRIGEISLYIHWPFCRSKCPYCAFNSDVGSVPDGFIEKYLKELTFYKTFLKNQKINSIYFGGGTPSLMECSDIERILNVVSSFSSIDESEVTIEINPGTVDKNRLKLYKALGINRVSVGVQSLNDANLRLLQRIHSAAESREIISAVDSLFENYSLDFIYALPDQDLQQWRDELVEIVSIGAKHLSMYQLCIEEGTPFARRYTATPEDIGYEFYIATSSVLTGTGYEHYEVSNFAKPGYESKHNMAYWDSGEFIGIGAGAHGRLVINGLRCEIVSESDIEKWLADTEIKMCPLNAEESEEEAFIMGIRTTKGVNIGKIPGIYKRRRQKINELITLGMLYDNGTCIVASDDGRLKLDAVIQDVCSS